jgi:FdhD protein
MIEHILSVPVQVGKTTRLRAWMKESGHCFGGFLMPDNEQGLRVIEPLDGRPAEVVEDRENGDIEIGRFKFRSAAFNAGIESLHRALENDVDWIIVDEIGPLEVRRKVGFEPAFSAWFEKFRSLANRTKLLIVIRDFLLDEAIGRYELSQAIVNKGPWFLEGLPPVKGVLLAGGESRRMGLAKPNLPHPAGLTWAEQGRHQLLRHTTDVLISGTAAGGFPDDFNGIGPIGGLLTAARRAAGHALLVRGVDYPNLSDRALARLVVAYRLTGRSVCFARDAGRGVLEPLVALYSVGDLVLIQQAHEREDEQSLRRLLERRLQPVVLPINPNDDLGLKSQDAPSDLPNGVIERPVQRTRNGADDRMILDPLAEEEPLEIRLIHGPDREAISLSVTMRTPGRDAELIAGFLLTEGIVRTPQDILGMQSLGAVVAESGLAGSVVACELADDLQLPDQSVDRNFYTTSSCGVCGKSAIDAVAVACPVLGQSSTDPFDRSWLRSLPGRLRREQPAFVATGGIHAAGWFEPEIGLVQTAEDVGRHNALDKLIGWAALSGRFPLGPKGVLVVSGRASFELVSKAGMAGVTAMAAVGAPSSLAVALAEEIGMTLIGFLQSERFNIYSHPERVAHS